MMRILLIGSMLAASSAAMAAPGFTDRFVDAKSGYVVESREVGSWLKLKGRHPESGSTFRLKLSSSGRVTGQWDGRPVDYRLGDKTPDVGLAARDAYPAGAN